MADELSAEAAREIRQLQKSKEKSRRVGNAAEEAAACNRLGEILAAHGRFREALEQHREELRLLEGAGDALGCAVAHRKVGERLAELQSFPQALQHQLQHLFLARQLGDPAEQQRAWATIGRTFLFMAEGPEPPDVPELPEFPEFPQIPEGSLEAEGAAGNSGSEGNSGISGISGAPAALRRALQAFHNSLSVLDTQLEGVLPCRELSRMRSRLLLNLALVQESLGNAGRCSRLLRRSALLAEQCHSLEDQFRAHFNLGLLQQRGDELPNALRSLGRARDCARALGEPRLRGEAQAALAQVLLALGDLRGAGRALRRALALGNPGTADGNPGTHSRRHARRVCRCLALLSRADPAVPSLSLSLCERLGDSLARLGHFQRAADFYQRQLSLAESLGLPARELAVIHVSLGTTFRDLGLHRRALQHFQSELELRRGEPLEECRTWLNVALALEDSGSAPSQVLPALHSALSCARSAAEPRLQRQVLRRLRAQQLRAGDTEGAQETLRELGGDPQNEGDEDEDEEEEEEEEDEEEEEESDLELSESEDDEEDLEGYPKSVPGRRRSNKQWNRRNERGETPLHRACIEGDLKRVRLYLDQGHPVQCRDYCGWTPLHEAANHGHLEIARLLLSRGAALDDAGGAGCEGVTPLHDALASGRFPVAQLLVTSGADLRARNARGQTPLQTLQEWLRNFGAELDAETWDSAHETLRMIRERAPPEDPEDPQIPNSSPVRKRQRNPDAQNDEEPQNSGIPPENPKIPSENPKIPPENPNFLPENPNFSSKNPDFLPENSKFHPKNAQPALIPLEEFVDDADWLEDDLGPSRKKARRNFREFREFREFRDPKRAAGGSRKRSRNSRPELGADSAEIPEVSGNSLGIPEGSGNSSGVPEVSGNSSGVPEGSGNSSGVPEGSGNSSGVPEGSGSASGALRIRIRIQDELFLIPVVPSPSHTVQWLCSAAAQRFWRRSGTFPRLRLRGAGALLEPQDSVADVLSSGDEVQAEIQGWDLPPLPERYRRICASLDLTPWAPLQQLLELQAQSAALEVPAGLALPPGHAAALLRALRLQEALRELRLRGCPLGEAGAAELGLTLGTLPRLARLELPGAGIGAAAIRSLCPPGAALQALQELDLSLNPLGAGAARALPELLARCPALLTLRLRGCGLASPFPIPEVTPLRTLSLSHNPLGRAGLGRLLGTLPARSLRRLELASVTGHPRGDSPGDTGDIGDIGGDIGTELANYLQQAGCALCHLSLAGNHLRDGDIDELARCLPRCPSLLSLDLSANPGLGPGTFRKLLEGLEQRGRGLELLSLAGCGLRDLELDGAAWNRSKIRELRLPGRRLWNGLA